MTRLGTAAAALLLSSCAHTRPPETLLIGVREAAGACTFEVEGRTLDLERLRAVLRSATVRRARIEPTTLDATYRCIAGAVYELQLQHFHDVSVAPIAL